VGLLLYNVDHGNQLGQGGGAVTPVTVSLMGCLIQVVGGIRGEKDSIRRGWKDQRRLRGGGITQGSSILFWVLVYDLARKGGVEKTLRKLRGLRQDAASKINIQRKPNPGFNRLADGGNKGNLSAPRPAKMGRNQSQRDAGEREIEVPLETF